MLFYAILLVSFHKQSGTWIEIGFILGVLVGIAPLAGAWIGTMMSFVINFGDMSSLLRRRGLKPTIGLQ